MKITVVGQGYVGLPLAIAASSVGYFVYGLDNNKEKIALLSSGKSIIEDLTDDIIQKGIDSQSYIPTTNQEVISQSQVILICVPTPLSPDRKPDLAALISATTTVATDLKSGSLVIVESTIEPGTCRNVLLSILIKESGLKENEFEWLQDIVLTRGLKKEKLTKKDKEAYLSAWSKEDALLGMLSYYKNSTLIMENDLPLWGTFKLLPGIDANKITVDVPTLVIWGELDFALRIENLNGLEEFVPNLKIERLPRATHWLLQEQEEKINKIINEYISN